MFYKLGGGDSQREVENEKSSDFSVFSSTGGFKQALKEPKIIK